MQHQRHTAGGGNLDVNGGKIGLYCYRIAKTVSNWINAVAAREAPSGYNTSRDSAPGYCSGSTDGVPKYQSTVSPQVYDWKSGNCRSGLPPDSKYSSLVGLSGLYRKRFG